MCAGHVGDTLQLTALAQLSDNTTADVTVKAQWSTSNATVATVNDTGLVSFRAPGDADILATYQGKQAGDPSSPDCRESIQTRICRSRKVDGEPDLRGPAYTTKRPGLHH